MPRIRVSVPEELLNVASTRAEEGGKKLDELYVEAIERYVNVTKNASAGSLRSRFAIPRTAPEVVVEIPEDLYKRADRVAKSLGKKRHVMYADALAYHLIADAPHGDSALDRGHDLPTGAWRAIGSSETSAE